MLAQDIMTRDVITVTPDLSIKDLAALFVKHQKNGFPVLDNTGTLVGIVTEKDLIDQNRKLHMPTVIALFDAVIYIESEKKFEEDLKRFTGNSVQDIYSKDPVTVSPETPVPDIAGRMADKDIHTIPVVDNGKLVGIIGKTDIIRGLASS